MKKLIYLLPIALLLSCNAADEHFKVGETVSVTSLSGSCNCVISYASNNGPYVTVVCEDEKGQYTKLTDINSELVATCGER